MTAKRYACGALVALALASTTPCSIDAQRAPAPAPRPGWLPRSVHIEGGITAAQRAEAVARLEKIERIVLQLPALANPQGFELEPVYYGGARRLGLGESARMGSSHRPNRASRTSC